MERLKNKQNLTSLGILAIVLLAGAYLLLTEKKPEPQIEVPTLDIQKETMPNAAPYTMATPLLKVQNHRRAARVQVFVPYDVERTALVAATKNALLDLYEETGLEQAQWFEVNVYLQGEVPHRKNMAALGIYNPDLGGYDTKQVDNHFHIEVMLIDKPAQRAASIDDQTLIGVLLVQRKYEQARLSLSSRQNPQPDAEKIVAAAASLAGMKIERLKELLALHDRLYADPAVFAQAVQRID